MAAYKKYDPRVDSLVVEAITLWDDEVGDITPEDKAWLSSAVHKTPEQASNIAYERAHTGFTRIITVTVDDIERLYNEQVNS